jgi:hypothetical protein
MSQRAAWKSGTSYTWTMTIFNSSGAGVTGRAGSITTKLARAGVVSAVTVTVAEIDSTNLPGWYSITYTPNATGYWVCSAIDTANMTGPWLDEIQATTSDLYGLALDSSGRPGVDWSNVGAQGSSVVLANTLVEGVIGAVGSVAGGVGGDVAGDVQGKLLGGGSSSLSAVAAKVDLQTWRGDTPISLDTGNGGLVYVDVAAWKGGVPSGLTSGKVQADVQSWLGTVPNALVSGNVLVDLRKWIGATPNALDLAGDVKVNVDALSAGIANTIAYAVWEALTSAHTTAGTFGKLLGALALDGSGRVTVGSIASNAIDAAQITAGAAQFLADGLLDRAGALEGVATVRQGLQWIAAAVTGKNAPSSTRLTPEYLGLDDATTRLAATVDATTGQRTAVTRS